MTIRLVLLIEFMIIVASLKYIASDIGSSLRHNGKVIETIKTSFINTD